MSGGESRQAEQSAIPRIFPGGGIGAGRRLQVSYRGSQGEPGREPGGHGGPGGSEWGFPLMRGLASAILQREGGGEGGALSALRSGCMILASSRLGLSTFNVNSMCWSGEGRDSGRGTPDDSEGTTALCILAPLVMQFWLDTPRLTSDCDAIPLLASRGMLLTLKLIMKAL